MLYEIRRKDANLYYIYDKKQKRMVEIDEENIEKLEKDKTLIYMSIILQNQNLDMTKKEVKIPPLKGVFLNPFTMFSNINLFCKHCNKTI